MSLAAGSRLGTYEILALVGEGGMGEVYRARDPKLGREVAIKVLHEGANPDHLLRFRQEARAASALEHPSIVHIYDIDEHEGKPFIVMEYARGQTLRLVLIDAPLRPKKILSIATQIADGLAKAHATGIVHRDLKPENVIVTQDGLVKILDFGLAKLLPKPGAAGSESVTKSAVRTRSGLVPGTVGYTSPEQASGRPVDFRADQFCLGLLLYEMATGKMAFRRETAPETLTAIIREEPEPIGSINPRLPPPLRWIIERCLAKDPEDRYVSTEDLARDLRNVQERLVELSSSGDTARDLGFLSGARPSQKVRRGILGFAVGLLAVATVVGIARLVSERDPDVASAERRLRLLVSTDAQAYDPDLSPDGKMIAYVAEVDGQFDLYVRRVAGGARVRLTDDAAREADPDFAPDGETIAFARQLPSEQLPEIGVIPALGGEYRLVVRDAGMPAWSPDGSRLVVVREGPDGTKTLTALGADGTAPEVLLEADTEHPGLYSPAWSPDGATIAVRRSTGGISGEIWTVRVSDGRTSRLWSDPPGVFSHAPVFGLEGNEIIHSSNRAGSTNLWSAPVDGGPPVQLTTGPGPDEYPSVAADGSVAFLNSHWRAVLVVHDIESGSTRELLTHAGIIWAPAFSPDGSEIAFSRAEPDGSWNIWSVSVDGGEARRLTSGPLPEMYPRFTPDGRFVVYFTWTGENDRIWRVPLRGGAPEPLTSGEGGESYGDVSPDGRWLAYADASGTDTRIRVKPLEEAGEPRAIGPSPATLPRWSPDGEWIAFARDRTYSTGIFLMRADGSEERRVSERGGWPVWLPDGERLAYLLVGPGATQQICIVSVSGGPCELFTGFEFTGTNFPIDFSPLGPLFATSNSLHMYDEIWLLESASIKRPISALTPKSIRGHSFRPGDHVHHDARAQGLVGGDAAH